MAEGPPSHVDCEQLAGNAAVLERVYALGEMPRLRDVLADSQGSLQARFAFTKSASGRPGAKVSIEATPQLNCQRCLQNFTHAVRGESEVEFSEGVDASQSPREAYAMQNGRVSLRELAEEELLLALPIVPMHPPESCARAPLYEGLPLAEDAAGQRLYEARPLAGDREGDRFYGARPLADDAAGARSRPFAGLQDLLKKT